QEDKVRVIRSQQVRAQRCAAELIDIAVVTCAKQRLLVGAKRICEAHTWADRIPLQTARIAGVRNAGKLTHTRRRASRNAGQRRSENRIGERGVRSVSPLLRIPAQAAL